MESIDSALLQAWINHRDAEAFTQIVGRYAGLVYSAANRVLGSPADAEDVAQECFLVLANAEPPGPKSLGGWLHVVATRKSLNRIRSDSARRRRELAQTEISPTPSEATWDDIKWYVDEALRDLPEELRFVATEHFLIQRTHNDIAEELGVTRQTVSHRIKKSVEEIRRVLVGKGISVPVTLLSSLLTAHTASAAPQQLTVSLGKLAIAGTGGTPITAPPIASSVPMSILKWSFISGTAVVLAWIGYISWPPDEDNELMSTPAVAVSGTENTEESISKTSGLEETNRQVIQASARKNNPTIEKATEGVPERMRHVYGTVYDIGTGQPVKNAEVTAAASTTRKTSSGLKVTSTHWQHAFTNALGEFHIGTLLENRYTLSVKWGARDIDGQSANVDLRDNEEVRGVEIGISLASYTGAIVEGRLMVGNGNQVEGADMRAVYDPVWDEDTGTVTTNGFRTATTNEDGEFVLYDMEPGTIALTVTPTLPGYGKMVQFVDLVERQEYVANFHFPSSSGGVLEGHVKQSPIHEAAGSGYTSVELHSDDDSYTIFTDGRLDGKRSAIVRAYVDNRDGISMMWSANTDSKGFFQFHDLPAGNYEVVVEPMDFHIRIVAKEPQSIRLSNHVPITDIIRVNAGVWTKMALPIVGNGGELSDFTRTYYNSYGAAMEAWGSDAQRERSYQIQYATVRSNAVTELDFDFTKPLAVATE